MTTITINNNNKNYNSNNIAVVLNVYWRFLFERLWRLSSTCKETNKHTNTTQHNTTAITIDTDKDNNNKTPQKQTQWKSPVLTESTTLFASLLFTFCSLGVCRSVMLLWLSVMLLLP